MSKPLLVASLLAGLVLVAGTPANAKLASLADVALDQIVGEHQPKSLFDRLRDSAPHSPFDQISTSAPRALFDKIRNDAP